jgi:small subunit ribosomal protein S21
MLAYGITNRSGIALYPHGNSNSPMPSIISCTNGSEVLTAWPKYTSAATNGNGVHVQVLVRDNNVDQALKVLKRKMQREGVIREMKLRRAYEKPSERRTREKAEAIRRARKLARKKAQREGLIPMPKRRDDVRRRVIRPPSF